MSPDDKRLNTPRTKPASPPPALHVCLSSLKLLDTNAIVRLRDVRNTAVDESRKLLHPGDGRLETLRTQRGAARIVRVEAQCLERGKKIRVVRQREILLRGQMPLIYVLHIKKQPAGGDGSEPARTCRSCWNEQRAPFRRCWRGRAVVPGDANEVGAGPLVLIRLRDTFSAALECRSPKEDQRRAVSSDGLPSGQHGVQLRGTQLTGAADELSSAGRELPHASTECRSRPPAWLASQNSARRSPRYAPTRLVRAIKFMWSGVFVNPSLRTVNEIPNATSARSASSTKQSVIGSSRAGRVEPATTASFLPRPTPILRTVFWRPRTLRTARPCTSHVIRSARPAGRGAGMRIWRPHSSSAMKSRFVRFFQPRPIVAKPAPFAAKICAEGCFNRSATWFEFVRVRTDDRDIPSRQARRGGKAEACRQWRAQCYEIDDFVGFQNLRRSVANGPPPTRKCSCSLIHELLAWEDLCRPGMMPFSDLPAARSWIHPHSGPSPPSIFVLVFNDALSDSKTHPGPTNWTKPKQSDVGSSEAFARKPVDADGWQKLVGLAEDSDSGDIEKIDIKDTYRGMVETYPDPLVCSSCVNTLTRADRLPLETATAAILVKSPSVPMDVSGDIEKTKDMTYEGMLEPSTCPDTTVGTPHPSKRDFSKPVLPVGKHVEHVLHVSSGTSTRLATRSTASPGRDSPRTPGGHEHEMATKMKRPVFRLPPSITKPSADVAGGAHELPRTRTAGGIAIASGRESGDVDRAPPGRPIHGDVG
ncbi:hypothetical protein V8D89_005762 [Ganoderma adspersum]